MSREAKASRTGSEGRAHNGIDGDGCDPSDPWGQRIRARSTRRCCAARERCVVGCSKFRCKACRMGLTLLLHHGYIFARSALDAPAPKANLLIGAGFAGSMQHSNPAPQGAPLRRVHRRLPPVARVRVDGHLRW